MERQQIPAIFDETGRRKSQALRILLMRGPFLIIAFVQHMTRWERPIGARQVWNDLHAPFQTRGFEGLIGFASRARQPVQPPPGFEQGTINGGCTGSHVAAQLREEAGSPEVTAWRKRSHAGRPTEHLLAEFATTTVRFLDCGFHVELVEQTTMNTRFHDSGPRRPRAVAAPVKSEDLVFANVLTFHCNRDFF